MTGEQIVFPDTGLPAWWCVCAESDCRAKAVGPWRTREDAEWDASAAGCDNAHFVTDRVGPQMLLWWSFEVPSCDRDLMCEVMVAHNAALPVEAS